MKRFLLFIFLAWLVVVSAIIFLPALLRPAGHPPQPAWEERFIPRQAFPRGIEEAHATFPSYEERGSLSREPEFSHPHGYREAPFVLQLEAEHPEAEIWFTRDGTHPRPPGEEGGPRGMLYGGGIRISETTSVTAVAREPGRGWSIPVTRSWIFLEDVLRQDRNAALGRGWPEGSVNGKRLDYGLDPRIVERYPSSAWKEAFSQIATVSLVTPQGNLTHPGYGIYTYPNGQGKQWERFASFEWIASRGGEGIQANAGVRIRGGFSRSPRTLKHSFRLFFRRKYGAGKLQFPLFGGEGADRFDKVDLRTSQNYSWARRSDRFYGTHNTLVRDVFCRDTQRDMGLPYTRSRYFHLFLNGQYWGIYMTQERPEAAFGATYFGADRDDYDTIKTSNYSGGYTLEATDGDTKAWRELWTEARRLSGDPDDARYARLTGLDESLSEPSGKPALVDIDNLISYMLIIFYSGNTDAPLSQFMGNRRSNNWYAVRNRNGWDGFRFFIHDAEHTLGTPDSSKDRTGPFHSHNQDVFEFSNPQWLHQDLSSHPHYRRRFAQLARKHLTGEGALTTAPSVARFRARAESIDKAIIAHSARWGDASLRGQGEPYTREDWAQRIEWIVDHVITGREHEVIEQLRADGLY